MRIPPSIDDFLRALAPKHSSLGVLLLIDLIKTDIELRRERREDVRAEQYLQRYPEIGADAEARTELLRWEGEVISSPRGASGPWPFRILKKYPWYGSAPVV